MLGGILKCSIEKQMYYQGPPEEAKWCQNVPEKAIQPEKNQVRAGKQCEELNAHQQQLKLITVH